VRERGKKGRRLMRDSGTYCQENSNHRWEMKGDFVYYQIARLALVVHVLGGSGIMDSENR
jgi:hypothetical protein